jgi:hypothetical protein
MRNKERNQEEGVRNQEEGMRSRALWWRAVRGMSYHGRGAELGSAGRFDGTKVTGRIHLSMEAAEAAADYAHLFPREQEWRWTTAGMNSLRTHPMF